MPRYRLPTIRRLRHLHISAGWGVVRRWRRGRYKPTSAREIVAWMREQRGWPVQPKAHQPQWRWKEWRIQIVAGEWLPQVRHRSRTIAADLRYKWKHKQYSKFAFQLGTLTTLVIGVGIGLYVSVSGVIHLVRALTETTTTMPGNVAFNAAGYDTNGGTTFVLANEIRIATSSAWWNPAYTLKTPITLKNLASATVATTSAQISVNTKALYDAGKLLASADDLRVVYSTQSGSFTELPRSLTPASGTTVQTSTATTVTFPLQEALATASSSANYAIYYGNTNAPQASYIKEKYLSFGGDGDSVYIPSSDSLNPGLSDFSFEFWVQPSVANASHGYISKQTNLGYRFYNTGSTWLYVISDQNGASFGGNASYATQAGQWYHVVLNWDRDGMVDLYINGILIDSDSVVSSKDINLVSSASVRVGGYSNDRLLNGNLDEFVFRKRVLTKSEITDHYAHSTAIDATHDNNIGLLLHLNEGSGQIVVDSSGNVNNGTLGANSGVAADDPTWMVSGTSAGYSIGTKNATLICPFMGTTTCAGGKTPTTETGAIRYSTNSAMSFDGKDDYVDTGINTNNLNSPLSLVAWVKILDTSRQNQAIFDSYNGSINRWDVYYNRFGNNKICWHYHQGQLICQDDAYANPGNWHLIAAIYTGSSVKIYIDGVLKKETATSYGITTGINIKEGLGLAGLMDEATLYDRELSLDEIVDYYNSGIGKPITTNGDTLALYHFDENGDDPRNTGKAIDASGNGNHGTINGAKYVTDSPVKSGTYASHNGIFIEEGTTNLVTNPSFDNSTFNTNWGPSHFTYATASATFTPAMAKRNSAGPFAAGPMVQGDLAIRSKIDNISLNDGTAVSGHFKSYLDRNQGSVVLWVTPEWNGNDGLVHYFFSEYDAIALIKQVNSQLCSGYVGLVCVNVSTWTAGTTYSLVLRWDRNKTIDGTNYASISVNDSHTFGQTTAVPINNPDGIISIGEYGNSSNAADSIIEGLTIYRRVLFDGTYGTDVGNGDEINQIYNGGTGRDPTLVTGSWDVVFALPTNAATGALTTGTGNAWSMPHASNLLGGANGKNGFMMSGDAAADGWAGYDNKLINATFDTDLTSWSATQSYTLRDEFTDTVAAGAVNGTAATPGAGTRTVTDNGNYFSVSNGMLNITGGSGNWASSGYYLNGISRTLGKMAVFKYTPGITTTNIEYGLSSTTGLTGTGAWMWYGGGASISMGEAGGGGTLTAITSYTATPYQTAFILRNSGTYYFIKGGIFSNWTLANISGTNNSATMYPAIDNYNNVGAFDYVRVPTATFLPIPLAYDTFTRVDGAVGNTETTGPDGQTVAPLAWSGSTWAVSTNKAINNPTTSGEILVNPGLEEPYNSGVANGWSLGNTPTESTLDVHSGIAAQKVSNSTASTNYPTLTQAITTVPGTWYQISGWAKGTTASANAAFRIKSGTPWAGAHGGVRGSTWTKGIAAGHAPSTSATAYVEFVLSPNDVNPNIVDDLSLVSLTTSELFTSVSNSTPSVFANTNIIMESESHAPSGLVLNLDSTSDPKNFLIAYIDGGGYVYLEKVVNGAYTSLINSAAAYSAGATLSVSTDNSTSGHLKVRVYYNNVLVGTEQDITDTGIINNTLHGLFSTYSGNTVDNFTLFARGTGGEYNSIPAEDVTATYDTTIKYKGTGSAKLVAAGNDANFLQSANVGDTNAYTLTAYAYTDGSAVTTNDLNLYFDAGVVETTFTSVGSGWYKLTGAITGVASSKSFGVRVKAGKTVYIDNMSVTLTSNQTEVTNTETTQKIFAGGYTVKSNQWEGLYKDITVTAGQDVVIRGIAHSDGTSQPRIVLYDQTNGADIGALNGTTTSTKSTPDMLLFTGEAPANCTTIRVKLVNASATPATVYWHQVEVYNNLYTNPSFENGSGDPWIPTGWSNTDLSTGESAQNTNEKHSGNSSAETLLNNTHTFHISKGSLTNGGFYGLSLWTKAISGVESYRDRNGMAKFQGDDSTLNKTFSATSWTPNHQVVRLTSATATLHLGYSAGSGLFDDVSMIALDPISLTVTSANSANSTETSGLRVDGADTLTQPITGLTAKSGVIKFKFTPRHSIADEGLFGVTPYNTIIQLYGNSNNTISLRRRSAGNGFQLFGYFNNTLVDSSAAYSLNSGTTYTIEISYKSGSVLSLKIDGVEVSSVPGVIDFATIPTTAYFGNTNDGSLPYQGTISSFVTAAATENTTPPYNKFGSKSAKVVGYDRADEYVTPVIISSNARNTLSAYVYDGTTGNTGGIVDTTVATLASGSASVTPTYADMGGGWWRLTYTDPTAIPAGTYEWGVEVKPGKTIYVDGVQAEQKAYATTYADGSLGTGYTWVGTVNNSSSTRTAASFTHNNVILNTNGGTISFWLNLKNPLSQAAGGTIFGLGNFLKINLNQGGNGGVFSLHQPDPFNYNYFKPGFIANKWYLVTIIYGDGNVDGSGISIPTLYSNGTIIPLDSKQPGIPFALPTANPYSLVFGTTDAIISDFRIFDQPLTVAEVVELYNSGLQTHQSGNETDDRYNATGTYTSPMMDLGANGQWGGTPINFIQTLHGGMISYSTRTSGDGNTWSNWAPVVGSSIASDPRRYLQWKADLTANAETSESPVITGMNTTYVEDTTAPANPGATAEGFSTAATPSADLTSGAWNHFAQPKFTWETGGDDAAVGQSASGIDGYHMLFTKTADLTPTEHADDACYQWVESDNRVFTVGSAPSGCVLSDGVWYLRLQTKDNSGNVAEPVTIFEYRYDGTRPLSPTSVSSTTVGYTSENSFTFYWPAATDEGGSTVRGYEYKTGALDGTYSNWNFTTETQSAGITAYQEGQNFFFVRTVDVAGNVSAETSNAAVGISPFYYNASAPSQPQQVVITPESSASSPAADNIFTVTWDKPATFSGEIAKYYYCVNCTPSEATMAETTAAETVDRKLTQIALATQQGKNTLYLVAEDNNVGAAGHGNRNFEAYAEADFYAATVAPAAPDSVTISDISDRDQAVWRLTLAWKAPASGGLPARYDVYRKKAGETEFTKVGSTTSKAYTDADLTQGLAYAYYVKAIDNAGSASIASNTVTKTPAGRYAAPPAAGGAPQVTTGSTTATVTWTTSRIAYGTVEYGKTESLGSAATTPLSGTNLSVKLTGLAAGTTYHYRVQSLDDSDLMGYERADAFSKVYEFTTLSTPEISDIQVTDITLDSVIVSWKTTSMASSVIDYGQTTTYGETETVSSSASSSAHMAKLTGLTHSTDYHFRVKGTTADGSEINSDDNVFHTMTFPKVTAMVFDTDQGASGTSIMMAWSTNVPTSGTVEYQQASVDVAALANTNEELVETMEGGGKQVSLAKLQGLEQAQLAALPIIPKGEARQLYSGKLESRHVMRLNSLEDASIYVITIRGRDANGLEAVAEPWRYVTGRDTRPPVISNMVVETPITGIGAEARGQLIVSFETDEPAIGQLNWGVGTGSEYPQSSEQDSAAGTKHVIVVRDLDSTTSYHFKINVHDVTGNATESEDTVVVTPAAQQAALDIIFKNLNDIFGFLQLGL